MIGMALALVGGEGELDRVDTPDVEWSAIAPHTVLFAGAIVMLTIASLRRDKSAPGPWAAMTVAIALGAIGVSIPLWNRVTDGRGPFSALGGSIGVDGFSVFLTVVIASSVVLAALLAHDYLRREDQDGPELYVLMLLSSAGGVVMASANDLIVLFLGLETLSIAAYILAAMHVRRPESREAGLKYFVLGAFSSAFFLYGIALLYGATGTTNMVMIGEFVSDNILVENGLLLAGLGLLMVGFAFKVAAAPFHAWTPDVYQGAPSPVVAYMASGVKAAGFAGLLRVFFLTFSTYSVDWQPVVYALAVASLLLGSMAAVVQTDVKRMMAYSSIGHAGFILVGVQAASDTGTAAALFYLAAYTFMITGTFGVITLVGREGDEHHALDDYRGLGTSRPVLALVLAILLLSQAGVPLTSGFFAKFYVISAAAEARSYWLAVIAMVAAVIAAYVYLRIIVTMYVGEPDGDAEEIAGSAVAIPRAAGLSLAIAVAITLLAGFLPWTIADFANDAVPVLVTPL